MNPKIMLGFLSILGLSANVFSVNPRIKARTSRQPEVTAVDGLFWERWSPRSDVWQDGKQ